MNQAKEGKISGLKDKLENIDKVNKEYGGKTNMGKEHPRNI